MSEESLAEAMKAKIDRDLRDTLRGEGPFYDPYPKLTRDMSRLGYEWNMYRKEWVRR